MDEQTLVHRSPTRIAILVPAALLLAGLLLALQAVPAAVAMPAGAAQAGAETAPDGTTEPLTRPVPLLARSMPSITVRGPSPLPGWVAELEASPEVAESRQAATIAVAGSAPAEVSLGAWIDYTFVLTNHADVAATLLVHDILPAEVREDGVACSPDCSRDLEVVSLLINMPTQYGAIPYTETITTVRRINWENLSLPAHSRAVLILSMHVTGQEDGTILENRAYIKYELAGGGGGTALSNSMQTVVQVHVVPGSEVSISSEPTSYFEDYGGSGSVDWGDFDRDGNLDLALGSSSGTLVYRNSHGRLDLFWNSYVYAHDVHWADFGGDNNLELVSIGYDWWAEEVHNHIYYRSPDGSRFTDAGLTALSSDRLLRVLPVDHDGDGDLDLLAVTYRRWTTDGCTVRLYPNVGGEFKTPYRCLYDPYEPRARQTEDLLSVGDYDNDDDQDLLLDVYLQGHPDPTSPCPYQDSLWVLTNDAGVLTATRPITVDTFTNCSWAVDAAWGDYDEDGDLDLAVALPVLTGPASHSVRIYRNDGGAFAPAFAFHYPEPPVAFAFAVDWGDIDLDGDLDLAVAGTGFRVYVNDGGTFDENRFVAPSDYPVDVPALDLALADREGDGDLDVAIANPFGTSPLFTIFAGPLTTAMTPIASWAANSVAWGDADGDGSLDLLFGASATSVDAEIYYNEDGQFSNHSPFPSSGFGPHSVAFGDVNGDGKLDIALGTASGTQLYLAGNRHVPDWSSPPDYASSSLAWADADDDGDLDLLLGNVGPDSLYRNTGGQLGTSPVWSGETVPGGGSGDTPAVAWADVDGDGHLDFATASHGWPVRLYGNKRDGTFEVVWSSDTYSATTSLDWGDYDGDGDRDLAVGAYGQRNLLYENLDGSLGTAPIWRSQELYRTTSLAWGDWDNDGDLDLAVGNDGEPDQVYLNRGSRPGAPQLLWLWASARAGRTTDLAWGDADGDGDLDLAVSGEDGIGYYENSYVRPAHLADDFVSGLVLSNQPSYLSVASPGAAGAAYGYASAERLSGPSHPTVTIHYRLYDADGTRRVQGSDALGDPLAGTQFEYSLDGGGRWLSATPLAGWPAAPTVTSRLGQEGTFVWNALADEAISDNALFRISIVHQNETGQVQRSLTRATSPPFRVRGTTCTWPQNPSIVVDNPAPALGVPVHFVGVVEQGQGVLTFSWDFGDGAMAQWQEGDHAFARNGTYQVRLTVRSEPCPVAKEVIATIQISAGTGVSDLYLPLVVHNRTLGGEE